MRLALLLGALVMVLGSAATAEQFKWKSQYKCKRWCEDKRYLAVEALPSDDHAVPAILANAAQEVFPDEGRALYFGADSSFAMFPFIHPGPEGKQDKSQVLVVSDMGIWGFVKTRRLRWNLTDQQQLEVRNEVESAAQVVRARASLQLVSGEASKYYSRTIAACNSDVTRKVATKFETGAEVSWGVAKASVTMGLEFGEERTFGKGSNTVITRFYQPDQNKLIEVQSYQACGPSPFSHMPYRYDVFVNGSVAALRPETHAKGKFPMHHGRPVIGCKKHYDAYVAYLQDQFAVFEASSDIVPIVVAMTAWWSKYQSWDVCEREA